MKTSFISSHAITSATRFSMARMQIELVTAQKEVTSGRHGDIGSTLGLRTGYDVSLRSQHASLSAITQSNGLVAVGLDITQTTLQGIVETAQSFVATLIAARGADADSAPELAAVTARGALKSLTGGLNTSIDGTYIFGGINTNEPPLRDYFRAPPNANRQSVNSAFVSAFGIAQSDPGISAISAADMKAFLGTGFAALFEPPGWTSNWSAAADEATRNRIAPNQTIDTSVSANEPAFAKLARAYTMVADLGADGLRSDAFQVILDEAVSLASEAVGDVSSLQGALGSAQEHVANSNERMSIKINIVVKQINDLEAVEPFEAATRLTSLLTQIETAYAVTARIQRLSLLDYL